MGTGAPPTPLLCLLKSFRKKAYFCDLSFSYYSSLLPGQQSPVAVETGRGQDRDRGGEDRTGQGQGRDRDRARTGRNSGSYKKTPS